MADLLGRRGFIVLRDPQVLGEDDQGSHLHPFPTKFQANARKWEMTPIKACDTTVLNKLKDENKTQIYEDRI